MRPTSRDAVGQQSRRAFLGGGAALAGLAVLGGTRPGAAGRVAASPAVPAAQATSLTPADFAGLGPCQLTPEQTEGPFYADLDLVRRDIAEGRAGHSLRMGIRVVDRECQPVPGALVDVWHCDIDGDYSAFLDGATDDDAGPGTTFLRGTQVADDNGIVEFHTVYPGWYTGRAVHVHVKVHLDEQRVVTTQLYFPENLSDVVHAQAPYAAHGTRDTRNETDFIAGDPEADGTLLATSADGSGTLGLVVIGVTADCSLLESFWYWLTGQGWRCEA